MSQAAAGGFSMGLQESEQAEDDDLKAIRVFVSGGGCGGMGYGMTFTDSQTEYDCTRKEEGFEIFVDAVALNFLRGVEIDYVERPTGASFVFNNAFSMSGGSEIDYVERPTGASFVFNNAFSMSGGSGTCGGCGGASGGGCTGLLSFMSPLFLSQPMFYLEHA